MVLIAIFSGFLFIIIGIGNLYFNRAYAGWRVIAIACSARVAKKNHAVSIGLRSALDFCDCHCKIWAMQVQGGFVRGEVEVAAGELELVVAAKWDVRSRSK